MPSISPKLRCIKYGMREDFTPIGSFMIAAEALKRKTTYPWLMGISGAAFRTYWSSEWSLDTANYVNENVIEIAAHSLGLDIEFHLDIEIDRSWELIQDSIDKGYPLLSCGVVGPFESCVIAGYEEDPRRILIRGYLDENEDYTEVDFKPWYGWCHSRFGLSPIAVMSEGEEPDIPVLIRESLRRILRMASEGRIESDYCATHSTRHILVSGLDAYLAWAGSMMEEPHIDASHRGFVTSLNLNQIIDARNAAQNFLLELCNRVRPYALLLSRAAEHYGHEVLILEKARELIPYPQATPEKAAERLERLMDDGDRRARYAKLLRTAREEELESLGWIRKLVDGGLL